MKESDYWITPKDIYPIDCFDPCPQNPTFDGLSIPWHGNVFCNPPYSEIETWIHKALRERERVESCVMLLPNWTDRKWFTLIENYKIKFYPGRLKFLDPITGKPGKYNPRFGSMLVKIK